MKVELLSDDGPIEVGPGGGKNSKIEERMDLFPPLALLCVGGVLGKGAVSHGVENWRDVPLYEHMNRVGRHWAHWLAKKDVESLSHCACRALMALELAIIKESQDGV